MGTIKGHVTGDPSFGEGGNIPSEQTSSSYLAPFGIRRIWLASALIAVGFFVAGLLLDLLLLHVTFISQVGAAAVLDAVFAITIAALIYTLLVYERERRGKVEERLEVIDQMNHHIRNALQVISFNAHSETNDFELAEMKRAMNRIQWALREILPRVEPEFTPFEGSARDQKRFDPEQPTD